MRLVADICRKDKISGNIRGNYRGRVSEFSSPATIPKVRRFYSSDSDMAAQNTTGFVGIVGSY